MRSKPTHKSRESPFLMGWRPTEKTRWGLPRTRRGLVGSCGNLHEVADPHQVVDCHGEGEEASDPLHSAERDLPQKQKRAAENPPRSRLLYLRGLSRGGSERTTAGEGRIFG